MLCAGTTRASHGGRARNAVDTTTTCIPGKTERHAVCYSRCHTGHRAKPSHVRLFGKRNTARGGTPRALCAAQINKTFVSSTLPWWWYGIEPRIMRCVQNRHAKECARARSLKPNHAGSPRAVCKTNSVCCCWTFSVILYTYAASASAPPRAVF